MPPLFYPTKLFSNSKYRHIFIVSKKYKSPLDYETGNGVLTFSGLITVSFLCVTR